jgi:hypothetical protein
MMQWGRNHILAGDRTLVVQKLPWWIENTPGSREFFNYTSANRMEFLHNPLANLLSILVRIKATNSNFANILLTLYLLKRQTAILQIFRVNIHIYWSNTQQRCKYSSTLIVIKARKQPFKVFCFEYQFILPSWPPLEWSIYVCMKTPRITQTL